MKVISGSFTSASGTALAGATLQLRLDQDAVVLGTSQIAPTLISITLDGSGNIPANTQIYANDELSPSGTIYYATVINNGAIVYGPEPWSITGNSPININNIIPPAANGNPTTGTVFTLATKDISANYTVQPGDQVLNCTGGASGITITLPDATTSTGRVLFIKKIDSGVGKVTVQTVNSQLIDFETEYVLVNQHQYVDIISNGDPWYVYGNN